MRGVGPQVRAQRYTALDGLRGIAALVVVTSHYLSTFFPAITGAATPEAAQTTWLSRVSDTPLTPLYAGNLSVCIFFVLSGFVLSAAYMKHRTSKLAINGLVRRYPRLMLPALASVLMTYILLKLGAMQHLATSAITGSVYWLELQWRFAPALVDALYAGFWRVFFHEPFTAGVTNDAWSTVYNACLWTMQIEIYGSMLVFGLLLVVGRWRWRWLVYAAAAVWLFKTYYLALILGLILSEVWHLYQPQIVARRQWLLALVPLAVFGACWQGSHYYSNIYDGFSLPGLTSHQLQTLAHITAAFIIVILVLALERPRQWLSTQPMQWLGRISFSVYLLHLPILGSLSCALFNWLQPNLGNTLAFWIMLGPSLVILAASSAIFTRLVDQPAIKLSRAIGRQASQWWRW